MLTSFFGCLAGMSGVQNPQQHLVSQSVVGPGSANSPLAMGMVGQPLSHEPPQSMMPSPGMMGMHEGHGAGMGVQSPMMVHPSQDSLGPLSGGGSQMLPQNPMVLQRMQHQPHNPLQSPGSGMQQVYPPGMAMSHDDGVPPHGVPTGPSPASQQQQQPPPPPPPHLMTKGVSVRSVAEGYQLSGVASVLNDPELQDVIRPSASGIPEFNLSRIIPSERPSSTLQYFPKGEPQVPKAPSSNPHLMNLHSMMLEQGAPGRPSLAGQQQQQQQQHHQQQVVQRGLSMHIFHPGQVPGPMMARTGMPGQHSVMGNSLHQVLMSPQQSLMAQQNMMLQAKQRSLSLSGEMYGQGGHMLPPQVGVLAAPPHQSMMFPQQLRQRSMSLDTPITFVPGPGNAANMPF